MTDPRFSVSENQLIQLSRLSIDGKLDEAEAFFKDCLKEPVADDEMKARLSVLEFENKCLNRALDHAQGNLRLASRLLFVIAGIHLLSAIFQGIAWLMKKGIL